MREILFRGKRISDGSWVEGGIMKTFHPNFDHESPEAFNFRKANCYCICANNRDIFVEQKSIGQFTGLTDKNGKKIFEGDIFRPFDNEIIVVAWIDYYSTLGFLCRVEHTETKRGKEITESYDGWAMLCDYELSELEVIGNIHDNPELLKGGAEK